MTTLLCLLALAGQTPTLHGPLSRLMPLGAKVAPATRGLEFVVTMNAQADLPDQEWDLAAGLTANIAKVDYLDGELSATFTLNSDRPLSGVRVDCVKMVETYIDTNGNTLTKNQTPNQGTPLFLGEVAKDKVAKERLTTRGMSFSPETQMIEVTFAVTGFRYEKSLPMPVLPVFNTLNTDGTGAILAPSPIDVSRFELTKGDLQKLFAEPVQSIGLRGSQGYWSLDPSGQVQQRDTGGAVVGKVGGDQKYSLGPVLDSRSAAYFATRDGSEIHRFGADGVQTGSAVAVNPILAFDVDQDNAIFASTRFGIQKGAIGKAFAPIVQKGERLGQVGEPKYLRVDRKRGCFYTADVGRVSVFNREGAFVTAIQLDNLWAPPQGCIVLPDGRFGLVNQSTSTASLSLFSPL